MTLATLNSAPVTDLLMPVPAWGVWWADVRLSGEHAFDVGSSAVLALADITCACTVMSGGSYEGRSSYRVAGGSGTWGRSVKKRAYANDAGVKMSKILNDVASDVGALIESPPTTALGPHYVRAEAVASEVLHALAPRSWRVDFDGVTRFGLRAATTYAGDATRVNVDKAAGYVELVTDETAPLVPGVQVDGNAPATDVEYRLDATRLSVRVYYGPSPLSRRLSAFSRIVDAIDPRRRYRAKYEYRVVSQAGERLNLQIVRTATSMPDLSNVPYRPGVPGARANVALGSLVLVEFIEGNPSMPAVTSFDAPDSPGWMPLVLEFGEAPTLGVARVTDPVVAGPLSGTIVSGSVRIKAGL